jgi:hypothetical protein
VKKFLKRLIISPILLIEMATNRFVFVLWWVLTEELVDVEIIIGHHLVTWAQK